jgi:hypothetical protein
LLKRIDLRQKNTKEVKGPAVFAAKPLLQYEEYPRDAGPFGHPNSVPVVGESNID